MSELRELHLSDEALLRFEMNEATAEDRAHLENCPRCRSEVAELAEAVRSFGMAARQFAAEKAATTRAWRPSHAAHAWRGLAAGLALAVTMLALLLGVGMPRWQAHRAALAMHAAEQRQQQLAADNALLEEVDQDVSQVCRSRCSRSRGLATQGMAAAWGRTAAQPEKRPRRSRALAFQQHSAPHPERSEIRERTHPFAHTQIFEGERTT